MSEDERGVPALSETPFATLQRWQREQVPSSEWRGRLVASGLDEESARVVVNSVVGAAPSELPEAHLSQGINPLAPTAFTLGELGMSGNPVTTGLYWCAFGGTAVLMFGVFMLLVWAGVVDQPELALVVVGRVLGTVGFLALVRGLWQLGANVSVKRRSGP